MKTVTKVLLQKPDGRFLLLRRSGTHPHWPYHLDLPGGEVEATENAIAAAVREIAEEVNIAVKGSGLGLVFDQIIDDYRCILYTGKIPGEVAITLSWEHDQHSWLSLDELLQAEIKENPDSYYIAVINALSANKERFQSA